MSQYKIEAATGQHIGEREEQQDRVALFAAPRAPGTMMAILADGRGNGSAGADAAEQVLRTARQMFEAFSPLTDTVPAMLETIAREAHTVLNLYRITSDVRPAATMVALVITPEGIAHWAHAGNSRLYRFDGPNPAERTNDHTLQERLIAEGRMAREDRGGDKLGKLLVNTLGGGAENCFLSFGRHEGLKSGDAFLLCSDGLWKYFTSAELGAAVATKAPREASEMLINKARERSAGKGADNATLAIVRLSPAAAKR
jgi:serine/threonine protein phosphatase PrpC